MIFPTGTIYDYIKSLDLQQKLKQKQRELGMIKPASVNSLFGQQSSYYSVEAITGKLAVGKKLSYGEMEYLRKHNPDLYAKAVQINQEREQYGKALKRCRTKDEAMRLNMSKAASFHSTLSVAEIGGNAGAATDIQMRLANISDEHNNFLNSAEYQKLKWEHEEAVIKTRKKKSKANSRNKLIPQLDFASQKNKADSWSGYIRFDKKA